MRMIQSRRNFLTSLTAGAASVLGARGALADEPPPEVTTIRIPKVPGICLAPLYVSEELLRAEGFTDIRYVTTGAGVPNAERIARGEIDFSMVFAPTLLMAIDRGQPITIVGGIHAGCFELFADKRIRSVTDLRGKRVGTQALASNQHVFLLSIATYVGLDPATDIDWVASPSVRPIELFADGKIDAFLGFPPEPQELRARNIGHVILDSNVDRPWSQYFCCMLAGNAEFIENHPIATKRVLRSVLKGTDLCVSDPERVSQRLVEGGFTDRYDFALQAFREVPYGTWRELDAEDTLRFYALRLHEAGMITSGPNQLSSDGTDWRFLNEIKRELKA
jgi:NitT/TauT family transport system substrate-binding protein